VPTAEGGTLVVARADHTGTGGADSDPRVTYPCYKSFDEFIDVGWLRSLDTLLAGRIRQYEREKE